VLGGIECNAFRKSKQIILVTGPGKWACYMSRGSNHDDPLDTGGGGGGGPPSIGGWGDEIRC